MYRAAVIGCGRIGSGHTLAASGGEVESHVSAYRACPSTHLQAVCDTEPERIDECARRWQVEARYQDAGQMLAEVQPQIVSICTPDDTHFHVARAALQVPSVRAILIEKPIALQREHALILQQLAKEGNVVVAVNYIRRYARSHQKLRDFLTAGGIGAVQTLDGIYTKGTLHNATHWFDMIRFLVGEVVAVQAWDVRREGGNDPSLDVRLELESGVCANLRACDHKAFTIFEMDIVGTTGRVRLTDNGLTCETWAIGDSPILPGHRTLVRGDALEAGFHHALHHAVEDLVECLQIPDRRPLCSVTDGLEALEIGLAALESAKRATRVVLRQVASTAGDNEP